MRNYKEFLRNITAIYKREFINIRNNNLLVFSMVIYLMISGYIINSITIVLGKVDPGIYIQEIIRLGVFFIPVFSMNLVARDRLTGELEIIMAGKIKPLPYVMGKFKFIQIFLFIFSIYFLLIPGLYSMLGLLGTPINHSILLTSILGYFLCSCLYLSIGVLISSINHYPASAGGITFGVFLGMFFLETFPVFFPELGISIFLKSILPEYRVRNFLYGIINVNDLVYFISGMILSISAAAVVVRWKKY